MSAHVERELKLDAPAGFSLARLPESLDGCRAAPARLRRLHTRYYDSADLRLAQWGCSLRYRDGEGWTLKLAAPTSGRTFRRTEHVYQGEPGTVPEAVLDLATPYLRGAPIRGVAELRTLRTSRELCGDGGKPLAEIVEDDVRVLDGSTVRDRFRQLEIELADGTDDTMLRVLRAALRKRGAGATSSLPKDARALGRKPTDTELPHRKLRRRSELGEVVKAAMAHAVERIVRSDAAIRLHHEAEAVHKARTSVRRLRSDLRTFEDAFEPTYARRLGERLRWFGDALGQARDADVLLARIDADADALAGGGGRWTAAAAAPFETMRRAAYERLVQAMREPQYAALLDDLVAAVTVPHEGRRSAAAARRAAPRLIKRAWRKVRKRVRARSRPTTDAELHGIRIKVKHIRYAAEAFTPVLGKRARRLARAAEALQELLGEQHDAAIAAQRLAQSSPGAAFVAGELAQREQRAADSARAAWRSAWRRLARRRADLCRAD